MLFAERQIPDRQPKSISAMLARLLTLLVLLTAQSLLAQVRIDASNSCTFTGEMTESETYGFESDREAMDALQNIMKHTGLPINFQLMAGNVPNAAAVIKCDQASGNCDRFIIYNQNFMLKVKEQTQTDWSAVSILAHEIGHHLSGHTLLKGGSRPSLELEADKFSGFVLYNLGATLEEALIAIKTLVGEQGSSTHPGRSARVAAITNGWIQASEIKPSAPERAPERAASKQPDIPERPNTNSAASRPGSPPSRGIYWRHDGANKEYALYVNGTAIAPRCEKSYVHDDYLVYDPQDRTTYILENFRQFDDNQYREGRVLGTGTSIYWRHDGAKKVYALYVNGETISSRCKTSYSGNDYIAYDPETGITYFLENFKIKNNDVLYSGRVLGTGISRFWRHNGAQNVYAVYVNGETIASRCNAAYSQDDYVVYDPQENLTYLLEDFKNKKDNRLRTARLLGNGSIYWRFNGTTNTYALIVEGEAIAERCESSYSGNDYIVYDPQTDKRYILENFKNLADNTFRSGRLLR
jgi:hypothetical protein